MMDGIMEMQLGFEPDTRAERLPFFLVGLVSEAQK
jgi:hypothetical protein